jgi:excisionase family DNA binding protein
MARSGHTKSEEDATVTDGLTLLIDRIARYLSIEDAAMYSSLGTRTIRRMLRDGRLTPFCPVAGRVLVDREELDHLIRQTAGRRSTRGLERVPTRGAA